MVTINQEDFCKLVLFINRNYGIDLSKKKLLVESRLQKTLFEKKLSSFTDYVKIVVNPANIDEVEQMLSQITTNYTYFMREKAHFDFLKSTVFPYLERHKKNKSLCIWSAGCSTGEEPYTISMLLFDYFGENSGFDITVLATDISRQALESAVAGVYSSETINTLPERWVKSYFTKNANGSYSATPKLKGNVVFRTFNLMDEIQFKSKFDVIFCRNVMIYFDSQAKDALVRRLHNATNTGGYLMIGHSETINKEGLKYRYIMPSVYRK